MKTLRHGRVDYVARGLALGTLRDDPVVSILTYRRWTDANDGLAFRRALADGKRNIYFPAGRGKGPNGVYLITTDFSATQVGYLTTNTCIFGDGIGKTIIRPVDATQVPFRANSNSTSATLDNIHIHDMTIYGRVESGAFNEHIHLLHLSGVRNLLVERVELKGFQGDGLYLGSGEDGASERHNYNATVRDCIVDGINKDNRNGISILDVDKMLIENTVIRNVSRSTMPGGLDIEPNNNAFHVLKDITVRNVLFENVGGNLGALSVFIPDTVPLPKGIYIDACTFVNCIGTNNADISVTVHRAVTTSDADMDVVVTSCRGTGGVSPVIINSAKGVRIDKTNVWENYTANTILGFNGANDLLRDAEFKAVLRACGTTSTRGILLSKAANIDLGPTIDQCGQDSATAYPVQFSSNSSEDIRIEGMRIKKRALQTIAINNSGHTFTAASNRFRNNFVDGLTNQFEWLNGVDVTALCALQGTWTNTVVGETMRVIATDDGYFEVSGALTGGGAGTPMFLFPTGMGVSTAQTSDYRSTQSGAIRVDSAPARIVHSSGATAPTRLGGIRIARK